MNFYHIINPYKVDESSSAFLEQNKTLDSIFSAIDYTSVSTKVTIVMKVSESDFDYFNKLYSNNRNVKILKLKADSSEILPPFRVKRQLPLLNDLLDLSSLESEVKDDDLVVVTKYGYLCTAFFLHGTS